MQKKGSIKAEKLALLMILFAFYVVGDLMTTIWLIEKSPQGIKGELNPLGVTLYSVHGVFGLIFFKLIIFIALALMILIIEFHYGDKPKIIAVSDYTILALMAWSIIAVTVNVLLIYVYSLQQGTYESTFLLKLYVVLFGVTMAGLILLPKFYPRTLGIVEIILAAAIILGPFAFSPKIYQPLIENPVRLLVYGGSMAGIAALMIFSMHRLYKQIRPKVKTS